MKEIPGCLALRACVRAACLNAVLLVGGGVTAVP